MYLRSGCDWHLDVSGVYTMEAFLEQRGLSVKEVEPIALAFYLEYIHWFMAQTQPNIHPAYVVNLQQTSQGFVAELDDHSSVEAHNVIVAVGFQYFAFTPNELLEVLPPEKFSHTCQTVHLEAFAQKRVLIIGGRQSAFECPYRHPYYDVKFDVGIHSIIVWNTISKNIFESPQLKSPLEPSSAQYERIAMCYHNVVYLDVTSKFKNSINFYNKKPDNLSNGIFS